MQFNSLSGSPCTDVCYECTGPSSNDCIDCDPVFYYLNITRYFQESDSSCATSNGPQKYNCITCADGYFKKNEYVNYDVGYMDVCAKCEYGFSKCINKIESTECKAGYRLNDHTDCEQCETGCKKCTNGMHECEECSEG